MLPRATEDLDVQRRTRSTMDHPSLRRVVEALAFAAERHRDQRRKDPTRTPYIHHPIALMGVLYLEAQIRDPLVLCAALLHDTVEDTETTAQEIEAYFGRCVRTVVLEVTDDEGLPWSERKRLQVVRAARASKPARLVALADKIYNLRDLAASPPGAGTWSASSPTSTGPAGWSMRSEALTPS